MKLELENSLLMVKMTISYKGKIKTIDKLVIDTGAAHTIISSDIVDELGIYYENGDQLVSSFGIGGEEYSFRKAVDFVLLGNHQIPKVRLDFGNLAEWGINGLIGLDILINGRFIIDLDKLEMFQ